ncbi:MAG: hypothetical protein IPL78_18045 [Chloroflexi bacterium]|nr:hypothetical protein [Chloroflexota bacterium]
MRAGFLSAKTQEVVRRAWKMNEEEALFAAHDEWMLILAMVYAWNVNREEGIQRLEATLPTLQAAGNRWWQA